MTCYEPGSFELASASGYNFLCSKRSGFFVETASSLRAISSTTVGDVCNMCGAIFEKPIPAEYQGKRGMVLKKFFPGMDTISTGGDYHLYIQGKPICWRPTGMGIDEFRLMEIDRVFKFTNPVGLSLGNVDDEISAAVVMRTSYMARLSVPDFSVDISGFHNGVATFDFTLGPETVMSWDPWRECWLDDSWFENDSEFDEDNDYQRRTDSYEYVGYEFETSWDSSDESSLLYSEDSLSLVNDGNSLTPIAVDVHKTYLGDVSCSSGFWVNDDGGKLHYEEFRPKEIESREVSMAGLFSDKSKPVVVWSGLDILSQGVFGIPVISTEYGVVPSQAALDMYSLPASDDCKARLLMMEKIGISVVDFLLSLHALRAGIGSKRVDVFLKSMIKRYGERFENHRIVSMYSTNLSPVRLFRLVIGCMSVHSLRSASLFLQLMCPVASAAGKLPVTLEVGNLHRFNNLLDKTGEVCLRFATVGDKLLRLVVNLSCLYTDRLSVENYRESIGLLTRKAIGKPLLEGYALGLTRSSADVCRARLAFSVLCSPSALRNVGITLGLLELDYWTVFVER